MKKLAVVVLVALGVSSFSGCALCFLPLQLCGACALGGVPTGLQSREQQPLPEVAPKFISTKLLADHPTP